MIDFDALVQPISESAPCGSDLDLDGDSQYLNFMVATEQVLPSSYLENRDSSGTVKRFDPKTIDPETYFAAAAPILARTRDLRLIVLLAKISILGRDLVSFKRCLDAIATLLDQNWLDVHPQGEDGDFAYRSVVIEAIDALPTIFFPLQFHPLIENRRFGTISYRTVQIAKGELAPAAEEDTLDLGQIQRVLDDTNIDVLKAMSASFAEIVQTLARIRTVWGEHTDSPATLNFDKFAAPLVVAIAAWLRSAVERLDPSTIAAAPESADDLLPDPSGRSSAAEGASGQPSRLESAAAAAAALRAASAYFAAGEPSSPALLLLRQAQQMVGKSFVEVMRMMVPNQMEAAAVNIGRDRFFDLPIERMAALLDITDAPELLPDANDPAFVAETRAQALTLMERAANYFRTAEPSTPIPLLIDKARDLAQRDFLSVLRDLLPDDALRDIANKNE